MVQCTAKSKQSGQQCRRAAMHGRTVCHMHGGKTPRGFALPQTKTGWRSVDLPTRLAALYKQTQNNEALLNVRDDIRLLDALIIGKFAKLDTGESGKAWELMRDAVDALHDGIAREDYPGCVKALREMRDVINRNIEHYATEQEITRQLEQRRKLVETDQKLALQGEQALSVERVMLLVGAMLGVIKTHVDNAATLSKIQTDFARLVSRPDSEDAGNGVVVGQRTTG